jgi:hypothetical protein
MYVYTVIQLLLLLNSEKYAAGASGDVYVFVDIANYSSKSIWATVERPTLLNNPAVNGIIYHSVGNLIMGP